MKHLAKTLMIAAFALPAGAVEGHFFRAEVETRTVLE